MRPVGSRCQCAVGNRAYRGAYGNLCVYLVGIETGRSLLPAYADIMKPRLARFVRRIYIAAVNQNRSPHLLR